ncbi:expressed unknown protein [Seminavis robusta]|uniref:Uncharacterized protein n=1 Tax=Seminavis robusta TaxID=568900 RepID=A0A9N8EJ37_9STRA|nr:expressed unknown protein [Seminavis robusta]|eukprot:Sro1162_g247840.1 n/a (428) ;mRNA; f:84-1434
MQDVWTTCGIDSSSLDQFKPEVGTQQAAQYSVFGFSWSSWHEQTCPPLPLKSDFKFNWTLSVENTEPTPDSKRNAPLDEALKAYPLTSKETIWDMKRKIAFANVGQAGGNDVRMAFPRMWCKRKSEDLDEIRSCVDKTYRKDSPISNAFDLELHMSLGSPNKLQSHTTFAFTMRNPIWRSIAAYQYLHHNNTSSQLAQSTHPLKETFYKQCFPTLVILLDTIDGIYKRARVGKDEEPPALEYCEELAITVFKGANIQVGSINAHLRDNYQYYYQHTAMNYPEKEIMAFRADHIWDDLENLDKATGGPGVLFEHDVATKDAKATKQPRHRSLCCVLWEELETYQTILNRATNLDGLSKAESMRDVWETCGIGGFDQFNDKVDENATRGKFDPPVLFTFSWKRWHAKSCPVVGSVLILCFRALVGTVWN